MLTIKEHSSSNYSGRTKHNATGRITVAIAADFSTAGEKLTLKFAKEYGVDFIRQTIDNVTFPAGVEIFALLIASKMKKNECFDLNIAGNGIYTFLKYGYTQFILNKIMYNILSNVQKHSNINSICSGGQTGMDLAGIIAAVSLDIPCTVTYPKGYKIRFGDGVDINLTEEKIFNMIIAQANQLKRNVNEY